MSKQWGHGYKTGAMDGFREGTNSGEIMAQWEVANEMRVILCALVTAHKREDTNAFWATVEIAKAVVGKYANFNDEDWAVFRGDSVRKDIDAQRLNSQAHRSFIGESELNAGLEPDLTTEIDK